MLNYNTKTSLKQLLSFSFLKNQKESKTSREENKEKEKSPSEQRKMVTRLLAVLLALWNLIKEKTLSTVGERFYSLTLTLKRFLSFSGDFNRWLPKLGNIGSLANATL